MDDELYATLERASKILAIMAELTETKSAGLWHFETAYPQEYREITEIARSIRVLPDRGVSYMGYCLQSYVREYLETDRIHREKSAHSREVRKQGELFEKTAEKAIHAVMKGVLGNGGI
ncbi:hypothetical protein [Paenibacillus sp. P22]|uniref:hypothetical protein n=1 Tax=Paenibacillus sp. P22 TaxID=483908 RepID=UPI000435A05E|nr:hypothetical protein [Paenibacillus sp. P22]CDN43474.1 hypothetical protein BN871_CZ_00450 [Paenibacillus sp. P22]